MRRATLFAHVPPSDRYCQVNDSDEPCIVRVATAPKADDGTRTLRTARVDRVSGLRGEEQWAAACIAQELQGAEVRQHDDGSSAGMYDLDVYCDGQLLAAVRGVRARWARVAAGRKVP